MRPGLRTSSVALALALIAWSAGAVAYDQQVHSTLWAEGYSVPARDGSMIRRRRIVEDLRLSAWNLMPGSDDPYYRGPRLSLDVSLRLDTDFAIGDAESRSSVDDAFVPGLTPLQMDALIVQLDARGFWQGVLDARVGRQIRIDTLGYFAFDGVETRLHLPAGFGIDAYIGYEVRGGDMLGYDALELDGTDTGGRHDMEADRYPDRTEPEPRMAVGVELSFAPRHWLDTGVSFRTTGLSEPLADERLGGRARIGVEPFWIDGHAVWCPMLEGFSEIDAELAVMPLEALTISIDYHFYRPVFDGDSIFNVFDLSPQDDLGGRVEMRLTEAISVAAWGFARFADESAGLTGEEQSSSFLGAGGGVGGNYTGLTRSLSLRANAIQEWGENRVGAELGAGQGLLQSLRLWVGLRLSYWHIEDSFSEQFSGDLGGYVLSVRFRIADGADVLGEFEHYFGSGRDQRFYALALLRLDLWR